MSLVPPLGAKIDSMLTALRSPTARKVIINVIWQLASKFTTTLATLLATILIARAYGPTVYGQVTAMLIYPTLFYMLGDFGLNMIYLRDGFEQDRLGESFADLLGLRWRWSLGLSLVAGLILWLVPYPPLVKLGAALGLLTIVTQSLYLTTNAVFQHYLRYDLALVSSLAGSLVVLATALVVTKGSWPVWLVPGGYLGGGLLSVVLALWFVSRLVGRVRHHFNWAATRPYILGALPLGLASVFSVLVGRGGHLALSFLKPASSLGYYGAGFKIFEVILVIPTFAMNAAYPVLLRLQTANPLRFKQASRLCLSSLLAGGMLVALTGFWLSPALIRGTVGLQYEASVQVLKILFLGLPLFFATAYGFYLVIIHHRQRFLVPIYVSAAIFNLTANLLLIPTYDFWASAWLIGLSELWILLGYGLVLLKPRNRV